MKKLAFLFFELSIDSDEMESLEYYKQLKKTYLDWKNKRLQLPKKPLQLELLNLSMSIVQRIENNQVLSLAWIKD